MNSQTYNVLFLCTGNSARSILAEAILNRLGAGSFQAFSAGSHPAGQVNPYARSLLQSLNYSTDDFRSKNWEEFADTDAPDMDFVFTVCDQAGSETCPIWPGGPMTVHWGIPDPAAVQGSDAEIAAAFAETYRILNSRIELFVRLPLATLDQPALAERLNEMGREPSESA